MPRKLSYLPVLALVALLSSNPVSVAENEVRMAPKGVSRQDVTEFNKAIEQYNNKDFQPACDTFKRLSESHPDFHDSHLMYGAALVRMGKPEDAITVLHAAEAISPDDGLMLFTLGTAYMLTGKRDRALEKFQKYVRLYPKEQFATECQARTDILLTELARTKGIASSKGQDNYLDEAMALGAIRWKAEQMPITVFIASGQNAKNYREEFADILKQCFHEWENASQGKLSFKFVAEQKDALIQCSWTDDSSTLANPAEGAEALPMTSLDGSLMAARIKFLTRKPTLAVIPSPVFKSIALHEVGHAIGLLGHSSQPGDVMLAACSDSADLSLSERDKKTVYMLYTAPESVFKAHPVKLTNTSYQGANTSAENRAVGLTGQALQEIKNENYTKAIQLLEEAKKLAPTVEVIYINLAKVYNDLGNEAQRLHDKLGVKRYYDLAIANLVQAKRKDLAVQYCDILMRIATQDSNTADLLKYKNLKREFTGSN